MRSYIPKGVIRYMQTELRKDGLYKGNIDGDRTVTNGRSQTDQAVEIALERRSSELFLRDTENFKTDWTDKRRAIAYFQLLSNDLEFDAGRVDGLWGTRTDAAYERFAGILPPNWREERETSNQFRPQVFGYKNPLNFPLETPGEIQEYYGPLGQTQMVRMRFPIPMKLAWKLSTNVTTTLCHPKLVEVFESAYSDALKHYGEDEFRQRSFDHFGGIWNFRNKRGGSTGAVLPSTASTHAWGIAGDINPAQNALRTEFAQSAFGSDPDNHEFIRIFHGHGLLNLGAARNFDPMHFQGAIPPQVAHIFEG